ncbi:hypothetical protein ACE5IS_00065 [Leptospira wolffii]|uniref:Uncharacterized protein n=1 Tax=Leptospira wolffii TaxID=409998 RepID=A0A2M9ZFM6_9LEPT|nr:hypothetical protein [Leptospira wolffii]PJZ67195.1 hypothetical protein CH371_03810 [Leptospira wolffii]TGK62184.1 hypothetical protein EHQ32_04940 [Leptospira wolffii]TGK66555.1 hypothetical protein EHQ27_16425 [Leptospira wolffii]TGK74432.1 hypothetical protein EHQ35_08835 [Leptospira wolffii]TGL31993.1 hypothetical protein EHQ57_03840 [Leptospira wolffii]
MAEKRTSIPQDLAQELVKTIRLLAMSGKKNFRKYLFDPFVYAGWEKEKSHSALAASKMIDKIQEDSRNPSYLHTIPHHCKRLVSQGLQESLSALGDSCIFFLEKMQEDPNISFSPEALEFVGVLEKPLKEFAKLTSNNNEKLFEDSIRNFSKEELKSAFEPVKLDGTRQKVYLDTEVHTLYQQILAAAKVNNLVRCKKLLSRYLINYSDSETYSEQEVENLLDALSKRENGFRETLKDSLAIELYYTITRGIMEGNAKKAIQGIRKYAHIFEGDPNTKYYYEIDALERKLYAIIQSKDLMKELRKGM